MIQRMLKRKVWWGGAYPLADLDRGGGVQIRCDTGIFETPKDIDDFTNSPLTDQISVLGGIVVPIADVGYKKKCSALVNVGLSRFQKLIGELESVYHR